MDKNKIKINNECIIQLSDDNYVVKYRVENISDRSKNKYRWIIGGYFSNIESAVLEILEHLILQGSNIKNITELNKLIIDIKEELIKAIKKYGK